MTYAEQGDTGLDGPSLLPPEESLDEDELDIDLDEGYSPPERPSFGEEHESLSRRLDRELPDVADTDAGDGIGDTEGGDGEVLDDQVGRERAGRLVLDDVDELDPRSDFRAHDVGVDGAGASAEEAAVHVINDDDADWGGDEGDDADVEGRSSEPW